MSFSEKAEVAATVLVLATDGYEKSELEFPVEKLREAGVTIVIGSLEPGEIRSWDNKNWGSSVSVDVVVGDIQAADYDGLILPGGQINPDVLRTSSAAVDLIKEFAAQGKMIAAICHAPWLLAEADLLDGKNATSYHSIKTDIENAGANWSDAAVVTDGNMITSRQPDDLPKFVEAIVKAIDQLKVDA
jgi:protease I